MTPQSETLGTFAGQAEIGSQTASALEGLTLTFTRMKGLEQFRALPGLLWTVINATVLHLMTVT